MKMVENSIEKEILSKMFQELSITLLLRMQMAEIKLTIQKVSSNSCLILCKNFILILILNVCYFIWDSGIAFTWRCSQFKGQEEVRILKFPLGLPDERQWFKNLGQPQLLFQAH